MRHAGAPPNQATCGKTSSQRRQDLKPSRGSLTSERGIWGPSHPNPCPPSISDKGTITEFQDAPQGQALCSPHSPARRQHLTWYLHTAHSTDT